MPRRRDEPSVSFHYLVRLQQGQNGASERIAITEDEFDRISDKLVSCRSLNMQDQSILLDILAKKVVPTRTVSRTGRIVTGLFQSAYSGHEYENSDRGTIPADSISYRPFAFLLYHSEAGRVYVGTQYLGGFGGYTGLKSTIVAPLARQSEVHARSFNASKEWIKDATPISMEVEYVRGGGDGALSRPSLGHRRMIGFSKERNDEKFSSEIREKVLTHAHKSKSDLRKIIRGVVGEQEIIEIDDTVIESCDIVALIGDRRTTIQLLDGRDVATKFPLDVTLGGDGHPVYEEAISAMTDILQNVILSKVEGQD